MKLAIIVSSGSKADVQAGHLLSGSQGSMIQELLGRNGIGWESVRVFSMLPFPAYAAPCNDAEGMERWFDGFGWGECGLGEGSSLAESASVSPVAPVPEAQPLPTFDLTETLSGCATSGASKPSDTAAAPMTEGENPSTPTDLVDDTATRGNQVGPSCQLIPQPGGNVCAESDETGTTVSSTLLRAVAGAPEQGDSGDPIAKAAPVRDLDGAIKGTQAGATACSLLPAIAPSMTLEGECDEPEALAASHSSLKPSSTLEGESASGVSVGQPKATAGPDTCVDGDIDSVPPTRCGSTPHPLKPSSILQGGIEELSCALLRYDPTMILALGGAALHLLKRGNVAPVRKAGAYAWVDNISDWRGSLFESGWLSVSCGTCGGTGGVDSGGSNPDGSWISLPCPDCDGKPRKVKALASYHPTWLQRDGGLSAYVRVDMARCAVECKAGPALALPRRLVIECHTVPDALSAILLYTMAGHAGKLVSIDSEGGIGTLSMLGFAITPLESHVIPFVDEHGVSLWTEDEEVAIWEAAKVLLEDPTIRKVMQNFVSDAFLLIWSYGIVIEGLEHDVMLEGWEAQPELEKGLASLASLYTREPFWKSKENYGQRLAYVCGLDCMLTLEVHLVLDKILKDGQKAHYRFNAENLPNTLYQMLEGLPFDKKQARIDLKELERSIYETQYEIDKAAWEAFAKWEVGESNTTTTGDSCDGTVVLLSHATSRTDRPAAWFGALAVKAGHVDRSGTLDVVSDGDNSPDPILALAAEAFGESRRNEKVEVVEERWQGMRWKQKLRGKEPGLGRWVKDGKLNYGQITCSDLEPEIKDDLAYWWKPCPRTITISRPVPIDSWETLERFCRESCRGELRRVRKLVKELENVNSNNTQRGGVLGESTTEELKKHKYENPIVDNARSGLRKALLGELSLLLGIAINSGSTNQGGDCQWLLHDCWGLPRKLKKIVRFEGEGEEEGDPKLTTDASMLLSLWARCQQPEWSEWKRHSKLRGEELRAWLEVSSTRIELVLKMRKLVKERAYLDVATDSDGHVRYGLNLVQAATGRFAAYGSPTGKSRLNPQTVGKKHRHLYRYENT